MTSEDVRMGMYGFMGTLAVALVIILVIHKRLAKETAR